MGKKRTKKPAGTAPPAEAWTRPAEILQVATRSAVIPIDAIAASPFQPRQQFTEAELQQLAESIAAQGLIHPIAVRELPDDLDHFELVDGERRWRACRLLGLEEVRAEVGAWSDAEVMQIVVASAVQRADLNPIEEAVAFRRAIDAGVAPGPTELARQLGVSQGHVSNRLRLLELPDAWQQRVISGEIPPTHARCLVRYKDCPRILQAIDTEIRHDWTEIHGCHCTVAKFQEELEFHASQQTRPVTGKHRAPWPVGEVPVPKFTEEQLESLKVIALEGADGKTEQRATNVDLWEKLWQENLKARADKKEKKAAQADTKAKAKKPAEMTPAEKRQAAAEEKQKAKERAQQFAKRLYEWHSQWIRYLIAKRLRENATMQELLVVACHYADAGRDHRRASMCDGLLEACKQDGVELELPSGRGSGYGRDRPLPLLVQIGEMEIESVLGRVIAGWIWSEEEYLQWVSPDDLERMKSYLAIDRQAEWREDQAGPLSLAFWGLHAKDQLASLAAELGVEVEPGAKKSDLVAAFMARNELDGQPLAFPTELVEVKRPK